MLFMHVLMSVTSNPIRKTDNLIPSSIFTIVLSVNNFAPMHVISEEAGAVRMHGETSSFILHQYSLDLFLFVFLQAPSCFWPSFESFIPIAFLHRPWGKITSFCLPFECCIPIIFLHRPWGKITSFCLPLECCIPIIFLHRPWGKITSFLLAICVCWATAKC